MDDAAETSWDVNEEDKSVDSNVFILRTPAESTQVSEIEDDDFLFVDESELNEELLKIIDDGAIVDVKDDKTYDEELDTLMDICLDYDRKGEMTNFSKGALSLLSSPNDEKSRDTHRKCQIMYLTHCQKENISNVWEEAILCNFFASISENGKISPGSFWCTCSCVRSCTQVKCNVNVKH